MGLPHHSFFRSTSLSLKTPFADAWTEKRGLQRRVSNRRKITEEEFGAAVNKIEMRGEDHYMHLNCIDLLYVSPVPTQEISLKLYILI